ARATAMTLSVLGPALCLLSRARRLLRRRRFGLLLRSGGGLGRKFGEAEGDRITRNVGHDRDLFLEHGRVVLRRHQVGKADAGRIFGGQRQREFWRALEEAAERVAEAERLRRRA